MSKILKFAMSMILAAGLIGGIFVFKAHADEGRLVNYGSQWLYVDQYGDVDYSYYGIVHNENGWWMVIDGAVDFTCNSVEHNENGWWKITNGKVDFGYTGLAQNRNGWWMIVNGKVDFSYNSVVHNENGWWKVTNGKVDFGYNGFAQNENGWWRIVNGKVDFSANGLYKFNDVWYYTEGGKYISGFNGFYEDENGSFWYLDSGMVNFGFKGLAEGVYGWWYVENGKINFDYTDFVYDESDGLWWYVEEGKLRGRDMEDGYYYSETADEYIYVYNGHPYYDEDIEILQEAFGGGEYRGDDPSDVDWTLRDQIMETAYWAVGVVPYNWGHHTIDPDEGGDCSGFTWAVFMENGIDLGTVSSDAMACIGYSVSLDEALPGDIVIFWGGGHVAIYAGQDEYGNHYIIHAPRPGYYVEECILYDGWTDIRRVID